MPKKVNARRLPKSDPPDAGSLLSPAAMGGLHGGMGYDAERDFILARLDRWLSQPEFRGLQLEGLTEVEVEFGEEPDRRREYFQIKDHSVDLPEGRQVLGDFQKREQSNSGPRYMTYTLACGDLTGEMRRIHEAVERYQSATGYSVEEKHPTLQNIEALLKKKEIPCSAQLLVDKVRFDLDGEWLKSLELRQRLFKLAFTDLPNYHLNPQSAGQLYTELIARIELRRGAVINRGEIEDIIHRLETPSNASAFSLQHDDLIAYARSLQNWLIDYQEELISWRAQYTPLQARKLPVRVEHLFGPSAESHANVEDVLDTARRHRQLILVGDPGSGKTTTALKIAYDLAEKLITDTSALIPVLVFLRELDHETDIWTLIRRSLARHGLSLPEVSTEQLIGLAGSLYLILEGVNEIGQAARSSDRHRSMTGIVGMAKGGLILTTRREGYDPDLLPGLPAFEILPLRPGDIESFLEAHFSDVAQPLLADLRSTAKIATAGLKSLHDFASNPLLLIMLALTYRSQPGLPTNPGELLDRFTTEIIDREARKGSGLLPQARREILQEAAARMFKAGRLVSLDRPTMSAVLGQAVTTLRQRHAIQDSISLDAVMNEIDRRVFRFLRSSPDKKLVEWEHHLFQEYYAASWLRDQQLLLADVPEQWRLLLREVLEHDWMESLRMLAGFLPPEQAQSVIRMLLELDPIIGSMAYEAAPSNVQDATRQHVLAAVAPLVESADAYQRCDAVRILGQLRRDGIPLLLIALTDEDFRVRREAASALDVITPRNLDDLDPGERREVRRRLADDPHFLDRIESQDDPLAMHWLVWLMSEMLRIRAMPPLAVSRVQQLLEAACEERFDNQTRLWAAQAMMRYGSDNALAVVLELALMERSEIGRDAQAAFEHNPTDRQIRMLLNLATAHSEQPVREQAQRRLHDYGDSAATATLQALAHALDKENATEARRCAAVLGFIGTQPAFERLVTLVESSAYGLRAAAAAALGHTGRPEAINPLLNLWRLSGPPTKLKALWEGAARGLIALGESALLPVLAFAQNELAQNELFDLVLDVLAAAGPSGASRLAILLEHSQASIRAGAAERLGLLRFTAAAEAIRSLINDQSEDVRLAAVRALYTLTGLESLPLVLHHLDDSSATIRELAAQILVREHSRDEVLQAFCQHLTDAVVAPFSEHALRAAGTRSIPYLLECLSDPARRQVAHELLVQQAQLSVEPLQAILANPADDRRIEALAILAKIAPDHIYPLLSMLLTDVDPEIRAETLVAVAEIEFSGWEAILIERMEDPNAQVRETAVRLVNAQDSRPVALAVFNRLTDQDARVRNAAVLTLRHSPMARWIVTDLLTLAIAHPSEGTRQSAHDLLTQLDSAALPILVPMFVTNPGPAELAIASDALRALGESGCQALVPYLDTTDDGLWQRVAAFLDHDPNLAVMAILNSLHRKQLASDGINKFLLKHSNTAIQILVGRLGQSASGKSKHKPTTREFLERLCQMDTNLDLLDWLLKTPDEGVRRELFDILRKQHRLDLARLQQLARSDTAPSCAYALETLGWSNTPEAAALAAELLIPHSNTELRRIACRMVGEAQSIEYATALATVLKDRDDEVRQLAVWGLGQLPWGTVQGFLELATEDPTTSVQVELARSLGQMKNTEAFHLLKRLLLSADPEVAIMAATELGHCPHAEAVPTLLEIAFNKVLDPEIRLAAGRALTVKEKGIVESTLPTYCGNLQSAAEVDFQVLAHLGSPAVALLLSAIKHLAPDRVCLALNAIASIGNRQVLPAILDIAEHFLETQADSEVIISICHLLGTLGDNNALPILNRFQRESYHWKQGNNIVKAAAEAKDAIERRH